MTHPTGKFDISQIRNEIQRIPISVMGGEDLHSIPDDVPIFDLGISSLTPVDGMRQVYEEEL